MQFIKWAIASVPKIIAVLTTDVWRIRLSDLPRIKSFFIKQLRVLLLALRGFNEDKCQLRASALTFYSLLSIVPIVAMAFGVAKGFGFENMLEQLLLEKMPGQQEVIAQVIAFAQTMLDNTKGGMVAGVGIAILFWTVIKVLGNVEQSFNDVWGVKEPRALGRKFSDYLSIMLLCPILIILSSSATIFITTQITFIAEKISLIGALGKPLFFVLKLLPYCVIWVLFSFIYIFMPNTKVKFSSGVIAGVIAGSVYQVVQWFYINCQVGVAKFNAIYGSFAALPLFLVWLQLSWLVVLLGAEISFAHQNVDTYEFEPDCLRTSNIFKRLLALRIAQLMVVYFVDGKKPPTADAIAHILQIPIRLVREIAHDLVNASVVSQAKTDVYKEPAFQPARDSSVITPYFVLNALDSQGVDTIPVGESKELEQLRIKLQAFSQSIESSSHNTPLYRL